MRGFYPARRHGQRAKPCFDAAHCKGVTEMTLKKAKKVSKRTWSFDKFSAAVKRRCKKQGVTYKATQAKTCYEGKVTIPDTVAVMQGS